MTMHHVPRIMINPILCPEGWGWGEAIITLLVIYCYKEIILKPSDFKQQAYIIFQGSPQEFKSNLVKWFRFQTFHDAAGKMSAEVILI